MAERQVNRGENLVIPARQWNRILALLSQQGISDRVTPSRQRPRDPGGISVRNDSGGDVEGYQVLMLDSSTIPISPTDQLQEFQARVIFSGITPTSGPFCITLEPISDGEIGRAVLLGVSPVKIEVTSEGNTNGWIRADVAFGASNKLNLVERGPATVLWRESGTGTKWAMVQLGSRESAFSGARVFHSTAQSIAESLSSGFTNVQFDREDFDTDGYHDNVTNNHRLTFPEDGYYLVGAMIGWNVLAIAHTPWEVMSRITGNGVWPSGSQGFIAEARHSLDPTSGILIQAITQSLSGIVFANSGEYAQVEAWQRNGGLVSRNLIGANLGNDLASETQFWVVRLMGPFAPPFSFDLGVWS